jgi:predicted metal-dependent peptidase
MAGMHHPVPEIAVVVDVSGSMYASYKAGGSEAGKNYNLLQQAIGETASIVEQFGQVGEGIQVFATSTTVDWVGRIYDVNDIKIPEEGGGTDIGVGMQAAYWADPNHVPNIMVVLTDGYTPWPDDAPPDVEVVIGIIGSDETDVIGGSKVPTWARVIWINK